MFAIGVASCALIGMMSHLLVFRPLRAAPVLAKVVASVGILLFLQSLTALQFGSDSQRVPRILPDESVTFGSISFPRDGLWLALIVVAVARLLAAYYRYSRIGLATRAGAENERAIALGQYSPQRLAGSTWLLSSIVAGTIGILVAPTTVLNPVTYSLAVVPALAAALIGRFQSIGVAAAVGLALGSFRSIVTFQTSKAWWPRWAVSGLSDALPLIIIALALFAFGDRLPTRGSERTERMPTVIRPRNRPQVVVPLFVAGVAAILLTSDSYRFGVITSMIASSIMLSLVLVTGMIGQISLAQAALAGLAGFTLSKLIENVGIPFPLPMCSPVLPPRYSV